VGYIKIEIVKDNAVVNPSDITVETGAVTDSYSLACGNDTKSLKKLTWYMIEERIIALVNQSKEDFERNYDLDVDNTSEAVQFKLVNNVFTQLSIADEIGTIKETTTDVEGTMTEVLLWSIENQSAYSLFKNEVNRENGLTTYVRYKRVGSGSLDYIYVKFTWTPSAINIDPRTTFSDNNKIKQYWYAANNADAGSGYDDIHGNVEVVGTTGYNGTADDEYTFDIKNTLMNGQLAVDQLASPYTGLNPLAVTVTFKEGGHVGTQELYPNAVGTELHTVSEYWKQNSSNLVATVEPTTGIVTYANNDVAKELLNRYDHLELSNTVTAVLGVNAKACTGATDGVSNLDIPVDNSTFNVKFLRPVTVREATATFVDAETGGSEAALRLKFVDWREHDFTDNSQTKGYNYFAYYGVSKIEVDLANATTDINGGNDPLSSVPSIKFSYDDSNNTNPITAGSYGTIKYENNGVTVGKFTVKAPLKITYDWGEISDAQVTITVEKTINNAKRH